MLQIFARLNAICINITCNKKKETYKKEKKGGYIFREQKGHKKKLENHACHKKKFSVHHEKKLLSITKRSHYEHCVKYS